MKQFGKILKFELKDYAKNKAFVGITIFLVVAIALVMFFPRIKMLFKSNSVSDAPVEKAVILIKAEDDTLVDIVQQTFSSAFSDYNVQMTDKDTDSIKQDILDGNAQCAFVLTGPASYTYYVNNLSMYDTNQATAAEVLQQIYQMNTMLDYGMTPEQALDVMTLPIDGQVETLGKDQMQNFFYTYIMIFALYMVILLYGQMVAMSVATEKSSRAMELLITSAKPINMMFGKVLAACAAGLVQLAAIFGSALLFYNINQSYWGSNEIIGSIFAIPPELLGYMLVFFLLGFLIYAFLFGAISSTVSKLEDINTAVQPVTFLFVIGFIVTMISMSSGNVDTTLMKVCSYIPFTSPMAMFTRIAMGTVAWYEIIASIVILVGSTVGIGILSAKIYRVGVLLYGTPPKLPAIIKAVWKA
ncbi:MAG: ABC transporter permease [Oscillospiraceae bacterium]|nr:ABC transporter permease [Oscillospiraceae bacterium]